jgi:photosystem II stability/assembly factor-like uncharacterized protein
MVVAGTTIYAGASDNVYCSIDFGGTWKRSFLGEPVYSLALIGDKLFAATDEGVRDVDLTEGCDQSWGHVNDLAHQTDLSHHPFRTLIVKGNFLFAGGRDGVFRYNTVEDSWQAVTNNQVTGVLELITRGNSIFAHTRRGGVYRSENDGRSWQLATQSLKIPEPYPNKGAIQFVYGFTPAGQTLLAVTNLGVYRSENDGRDWQRVSDIFVDSADKQWLATIGNTIFDLTAEGVFRSEDRGAGWHPADIGIPSMSVTSLVTLGGLHFAAAGGRIFQSKNLGMSWELARLPGPRIAPSETLFLIGRTVLSSSGDRTEDLGNSWQEFTSGLSRLVPLRGAVEIGGKLFLAGPSFSVTQQSKEKRLWNDVQGFPGEANALAALGGTLFVGTDHGVFRSADEGKTWKETNTDLVEPNVRILNSTDSVLFAVASKATLFKLEGPAAAWRKLTGNGLPGQVLCIWVDHIYPDVVIVGTDSGLFWSIDGGQQFYPAAQGPDPAFKKVYAINQGDGDLLVGTDAGVLFLIDNLPRPTIIRRLEGSARIAWAFFKDHYLSSAGTTLFVILALLLGSPRVIIILKRIPKFREQVLLFYQTPFGRWKLYRHYVRSLKRDPEIQLVHRQYLDLPFTATKDNGKVPEPSEKPLSEFIQQAMSNCPVVIVAGGGYGKSTACLSVASRAANTFGLLSLLRSKALPVPAIVRGPLYGGSIVTKIRDSLSNRGAVVDEEITISQFLAGHIFVVFDGLNEIDPRYQEQAQSTDIPPFVETRQQGKFMLATRGRLPKSIALALSPFVTVDLSELDDESETKLFSKYLSNATPLSSEEKLHEDVQLALGQLHAKLSELPRIPLMIRLAAESYAKNHTIPNYRSQLFDDYIGKLLDPVKTRLPSEDAAIFAVLYLIRNTYLRSKGRHGLTYIEGVNALGEIHEKLSTHYGFEVAAVDVLRRFIESGLYKRNENYLTFFHPSFESYFAAKALFELLYTTHVKEDLTCLIESWAEHGTALKETWEFLRELIGLSTHPPDLQLLEEAAKDCVTYLRCQPRR